MTIAIKHAFVSLKGDGTDVTQVQPSNWNAAHSLTLATGNLVGRLSAGAGNAEEIPISAYMAGLLNTPDAPTLAGILGLFDTGDVKYTFKNTAPAGWVTFASEGGGTIGSALSGATARANADTWPLYNLLYTNVADAYAPVVGGRSGNALTDFNANKPIWIPPLGGRAPIGVTTGGLGVSARSLGSYGGEENHVLVTTEMPVHRHAVFLVDPGHTHGSNAAINGGGSSTQGGGFPLNVPGAATISAAVTNMQIVSGDSVPNSTYVAGAGGQHNNMQPWITLGFLVKL